MYSSKGKSFALASRRDLSPILGYEGSFIAYPVYMIRLSLRVLRPSTLLGVVPRFEGHPIAQDGIRFNAIGRLSPILGVIGRETITVNLC
jgi:hypothetical protein